MYTLSSLTQDRWPHECSTELVKVLGNLEELGINIDGDILEADSIKFGIEDLKANVDFLHEMVPALDIIASALDDAEAKAESRSPRGEQPFNLVSTAWTLPLRLKD